MSLARLQKQLVRDIQRDPKKAVVLALVSLVAVYYWAPLLIGKKSNARSPAATTPAAVATTPVTDDVAAKMDWRQVARLIEQDRRMASAESLAMTALPFASPPEVKKSDPQEQLAAGLLPPADPTPAELGLVLSGTVAGRGRGVALINSRPYAQGSTIRVADDSGKAWSFEVREVGERFVVLVREDKEYRLSLPEKRGWDDVIAP